MGSYMINITTKNIEATTEGQQSVRIHFSKYAYKPGSIYDYYGFDPHTRYCGPNARAWEQNPELNARNNLYVETPSNKTELAEHSDLMREYDKQCLGYAFDRVPDEGRCSAYGLRVYRGYNCSYLDDAPRELAGFLIPRGTVLCGLPSSETFGPSGKPNARTTWHFIEAEPKADKEPRSDYP